MKSTRLEQHVYDRIPIIYVYDRIPIIMGGETMKCPLLHRKGNNPDVFPSGVFEDCLEKECAWWSEGSCAVKQLIKELDKIGGVLAGIRGV